MLYWTHIVGLLQHHWRSPLSLHQAKVNRASWVLSCDDPWWVLLPLPRQPLEECMTRSQKLHSPKAMNSLTWHKYSYQLHIPVLLPRCTLQTLTHTPCTYSVHIETTLHRTCINSDCTPSAVSIVLMIVWSWSPVEAIWESGRGILRCVEKRLFEVQLGTTSFTQAHSVSDHIYMYMYTVHTYCVCTYMYTFT